MIFLLLILKKDYLTAKQILENILRINPNDNVATINLKNLEEVIKKKSQKTLQTS